MRSAAVFALAVLLAAAPAALAQEPPPAPPTPAPAPAPAPKTDEAKPAAPKAEEKPAAPAKHVNKVSEAAKAAWEGFRKSLHTAESSGIKEFKGRFELVAEAQGINLPFAIEFTAPETLKIELKSDDPQFEMFKDMIVGQVSVVLRLGLSMLEPKPDGEFDADVVVEKDVKTLVLKTFNKNEQAGEFRFTLGTDGLPSKGVQTSTDPMSGMEQEIEFAFGFQKDGERSRLVKLSVNSMMGNQELKIDHVDAGGFKVLRSIKSDDSSITFTELTVNGKKVEFPKPEVKVEPAKPAGGTATPPGEAGKEEKKPEEKKPEEPKPEEPKPEEKKGEPK